LLMNKLALIIAPLLLISAGMAQSRTCLRIMPMDELIRGSIWIGRVKVRKVSKANYRGSFGQLAHLQVTDTIDGDSTVQERPALAKSNVPCATDIYEAKQEMLVFLKPEDSLFRTNNFQYGQFVIVGDLVKGWRDKTNGLMDKPYAEVRKEIEDYLKQLRNPQAPPVVPQAPPIKPKPAAPF
jgi:hypothetical protein